MSKIKLGDKVTDSISGFTGIAVARVEYLTGCTQVGVVARVDKDGKKSDIEYFDESRLDGTILTEETRHNNGGVNRDCPKH